MSDTLKKYTKSYEKNHLKKSVFNPLFRIKLTHFTAIIILIVNILFFTENAMSTLIQLCLLIIIILHDFDDDFLKSILENHIKNLQARESKLQESQEALYAKANYDALTGLPNRALFNDRLQQAVIKATREKQKFALLFIDLDKFKSVNDTYGHTFGDNYLIEVSRRIQNVIRDLDTFARIGGDEFTIVMNDIQRSEDVITLLDKIFHALQKPLDIQRTEIFIQISIGISIYPQDTLAPEALLSYADTAMYDAKSKEGNSFSFFDTYIRKKTKIDS